MTPNLTPKLKLVVIAVLAGAVSLGLGALALPAFADTPTPASLVEQLKPKPHFRSLRGISVEGGETTPEPPPQVNLHVNFEFDSPRLTADGVVTLTALGVALRDPQLNGLRFKIIGHTDATGKPAYNMELSIRRANTVVAFLTDQQRIDRARLEPSGRGAEELADPINKEDGINRRVQVVTIGTPNPAPEPIPVPNPNSIPPISKIDPPPSHTPPPNPPSNQRVTSLDPAKLPPRPSQRTNVEGLTPRPRQELQPDPNADPANAPAASEVQAKELAARLKDKTEKQLLRMADDAAKSVGLTKIERLKDRRDDVQAWILATARRSLEGRVVPAAPSASPTALVPGAASAATPESATGQTGTSVPAVTSAPAITSVPALTSVPDGSASTAPAAGTAAPAGAGTGIAASEKHDDPPIAPETAQPGDATLAPRLTAEPAAEDIIADAARIVLAQTLAMDEAYGLATEGETWTRTLAQMPLVAGRADLALNDGGQVLAEIEKAPGSFLPVIEAQVGGDEHRTQLIYLGRKVLLKCLGYELSNPSFLPNVRPDQGTSGQDFAVSTTAGAEPAANGSAGAVTQLISQVATSQCRERVSSAVGKFAAPAAGSSRKPVLKAEGEVVQPADLQLGAAQGN